MLVDGCEEPLMFASFTDTVSASSRESANTDWDQVEMGMVPSTPKLGYWKPAAGDSQPYIQVPFC